jgi:thymidine kinase
VCGAVIRMAPDSGGWLEVVCGPMFSGKSEELIRRLRRAEIAGQRVLIVKPRIDDRYDVAHVVSHAGAKMRAVAVEDAADALGRADTYDAIGIDEAQFFDDDIVDAVRTLVARGKRVVVAGLDRDFRGEPFGPMPVLLCLAEFVDKLHAVCHACGGTATRTQRLVDGYPAPFAGATIQIGALDSYEARCASCYRAGAPVQLTAVS